MPRIGPMTLSYNSRMWRSRIFWRLFGVYCVLLVVALGFLDWMILHRIQAHLLDEVRQHLEIKAQLVGELTSRRAPVELQAEMSRWAVQAEARITLIHADGKVLADSHEDPARMENHGERPEVRDAERQTVGVSTRFSETIHTPMMFVARRRDGGDVRYVRLSRPLDAVYAEVQWLSRVVWTATGITLLVGWALSFAIARRISAPLEELAATAKSIAQGEYGKRVLISSTDEIGALARSFNEMSISCANHIAQMDQDRQQLLATFRSMVEGVVVLDATQTVQFMNEAARQLLDVPGSAAQGRKVWEVLRYHQFAEAVERILASDEPYRCEIEWPGTERKVFGVHGTRLPGQPVRGAVLVLHDITQVRVLERVRQDFVANVSHELKTPLAAIQATVETLLDGALQDPQHNTRFMERIRENADRLHRLVQDLLTLRRIESGREVMELQPIPLHFVVDTCLSRQIDRAKAKGLQILEVAPPEPVQAHADEEALAEILDNLVDNAIKYTPSGSITLRWFAAGAEAVLQVEDTGVGIPAKDLPRVFERFYRVDKARSRELGGTGLGLSIVKHLVQTLGGSVSVTSELGRGTTMTVRLPRFAPVDGNAP